MYIFVRQIWPIILQNFTKFYKIVQNFTYLYILCNGCLSRTDGLRMYPGHHWWLGTLLRWLPGTIRWAGPSLGSLVTSWDLQQILYGPISSDRREWWMVLLHCLEAYPSVTLAGADWNKTNLLEASRSHQGGPAHCDCAVIIPGVSPII